MVKQPALVITGGAGYIGSHIAYLCKQHNYTIIILDLFFHNQYFNPSWATIIKGDFSNKKLLAEIFSHYDIKAVIHCAAFIEVGQSVTNPSSYYENNVAKTLVLLQSMIEHGIKKIVFSSSCAVYGNPEFLPLIENHPKNPISPYGKTKLMVEMMLEDFQRAYGLEYVCLRYFNAAGALPEEGLGEQHQPESHLIPRILQAALEQTPFTIYGNDYETKDGTAIRDYVHVLDIAHAHLLALCHLEAHKPSDAFNLGSGHGFSIKEVVEAVEKVCQVKIKTVVEKRRAGDPAALVADSFHIQTILQWQRKYSQLAFIVQSACLFEQQRTTLLKKHLIGI